jgi:hypothetical protein
VLAELRYLRRDLQVVRLGTRRSATGVARSIGGSGVAGRERPREPSHLSLGEPAARELLDVLTRSDADRAALIGRLHRRDDARWLAELLTDLEVDETARLQLAEGLRRVLA